MKMFMTVISGLVAALALFSPLQDVKHFWANKKRLLYAVGLFATAFVFVMAAIIIGAVESALQIDAQGFVMWSAMYSLALWLAAAAIGSWISAKLLIPTRLAAQPTMAEFSQQFGLVEIFENFLKQAAMPRAEPPAAPVADQAVQYSGISRQLEEEVFARDDRAGHTH